ncbi:SusC/RagA family TonB-linked outer membrane protein [Seonamhaeicola maritimus]|uniref:TonB-dependent receptor n=1 Tax=Seonamhaeicola maritimus TaxID=2591822 RepID=A0A5C7GHS7_9FLAO|nr:TonB-dependent receptor [Seonamhaeicola maritimus]TXG37134.1 TonB-dependent receptor [Seonamhaeicola maritimus]
MKKQFSKLLRACSIFGLVLALMSFQETSAQQTVSGTVVDESGVGIPGANVLVKGTSKGSVTDFDGNFSISASSSDVLEISFLGYVTQSVTVGDQTSITVTLVEDAAQLDEVVVIGYGTAKKSDITGAVSRVTSQAFEDQPMTRVEDALQGRAAGVTVAKQSGAPGAPVKIRIRGTNSITGNNDPLVVIDGIIGGDLRTLNPNDIATLDILKDASATAIYGSRGANGVILISTKKGSGKGKLDVDMFTSFSEVPDFLPTLQGSRAGDFARIENQLRGNEFIPLSEIQALDQIGGVDYQKELFQTAMTSNVQLSYSGGNENVNYFVSGNYSNQEGIVITTGYERYSIRANVSSQITDKLKIGVNIFGSRATSENDINSFSRFQGSLVAHAVTWDPTTPLRDADGNWNEGSTRSLASLNYNPIARLHQSDIQEVQDRLNTNVNVSYDILENLNYTLIAGASTYNRTQERITRDYGETDAAYNGNTSRNHQVSNIVTYNKSLNNHNFKLTGVYEFQEGVGKVLNLNLDNLTGPLSYYLAELNSGIDWNNNKTENSIESVMGRLEYNFNEKLFLTGTVRRDGSSRFQGDNKWGTFYSFAGSYNLTDSSFIQDSGLFSSLKVRAGWGQVGNQNIGIYSTFDSVSLGSVYAFDGAVREVGSTVGNIGNANTTWETTTQTNVGVDFGILDGKIDVSLDWYTKSTTDLLLAVPIPATLVGPSKSQIQNVGEVENSGIDIAIGATIVKNDNFSWDSNLSMSFVKNKIVDLGLDPLGNTLEEIQGQFGSIDGQGRTWNVFQLGQPLGQIQGSTFLGTWKTSEAAEAAQFNRAPGDAKYLRDANGDRVISVIGNGTPTMLWGWNNTLAYKDWDLNFFFQGSHGNEMLNAFKGTIVGATGNQRSFGHPMQLNQWTSTNETDIPAGGENDYGSTRYIENGGFVRLANLNIGYTFNDVKGFDSIKVYAGGQNLFLITDYEGYDPELTSRPANNNGTVDAAPGIDIGAYPNPRVYNVGVKFRLKN